MQNTSSGDFDADTFATRLDIVRAAAHLPLVDKNSNYVFTDTSAADVVRAAKSGLVHGYDDQTFRPQNSIAREELAKILAQMIPSLVSTDGTKQNANLPLFSDSAEIGEWARDFVTALVRDGVINGYPDGTFRPKNSVTRAEFAVMFARILQKYSPNEVATNIFSKATVVPITYLDIPNGFVAGMALPSIDIQNLQIVEYHDDLDAIEDYAGHFDFSSIWNGNVGILGHNWVDKEPYFRRLDDIKTGDKIIYKTKYGVQEYTVTLKCEIDATDWSYLERTDKNKVTIVTCLHDYADTTRVLVQAEE